MHVMKNEQGTTLIELVVVMVILSTVGIMITAPLIETSIGWREISSRKHVMQLARFGMDKMVRTLRNTERLASNAPNISINSTATCLSFRTTDNLDLTFNLNGTVLEECLVCDCGAITAPNDLAINVAGFVVTCFDAANTAVACNTVATVRRVKLQLSVTENGETVNLDSEVTLRNLIGV